MLGSGDDVFAAASSALKLWKMHEGAGFDVLATDPSARPGASVLITFRLWPVWVTVACRVVDVLDTKSASGFTYATLPLHAERGEQTFLVSRGEDAQVTFSVSSTSRPKGLLARAGAPVTAILQRRAAGRYLLSMRELSGGPPG